MISFNLDDLVQIMTECAGVSNTVDLRGPISDVPFEALDYDSLALLQLGCQLESRLSIVVDDSAICEFHTPRHVIDYVNRSLAEV